MHPFFSRLAIIAVCLLAGCGGGGDPAPAVPDAPPPVADAGRDQTVVAGSIVSLDGRASTARSGRPLTHAWVLSAWPTGSKAALASANQPQAQLMTDLPGSYRVELTVHDGLRASQASSVTVQARALQMGGATAAPANQMVLVLDAPTAIQLPNGATRYGVRMTERNPTGAAMPGSYLVLWFSNGFRLAPSFFQIETVPPGSVSGLQRSYAYEAPSDWTPLLWEYGTPLDARSPDPALPHWRFLAP